MPAEEFRAKYALEFPHGGPPSDHQVGRMALCFKVSKSAVAIRFEEVGLAAKGFYDRLRAGWNEPSARKRRGGKERDQIDIELGRLGTTHVSAIATAVERGIIDRLEARYALDVPIEHLPALRAAARVRHEAYGPAR
jgi:Zn-dependent peptidase ImmA (M78 family)